MGQADESTPFHRRIAIGAMRLSTAADRDESRAIAVLHAALDAGVTLIDTADAYCLDDTETGHNERLVARALAAWTGDRSRVRVATKGGLIRPQGRWEPDGRARALTAACEASLRALETHRIDLYQLHVPDPRVPFATSVRALQALARRGLIEAVGLCNVTVGQIEEARRITEIASVQVELSLWQDASILGGVVEYCTAHGIPVLAYRPLGGHEHRRRLEGDPILARLAAAHAATSAEIALAAVADLSPMVRPLPGPTRVTTAESCVRAGITLTDDDRALLRERFPASRGTVARSAAVPADQRRLDGEIVLLMGLPGAGKSTVAGALVADGYTRLNRDEAGGSPNALIPALEQAIVACQVAPRATSAGTIRTVLDNTYVTRKARGAVIHAAGRHGLSVRCIWTTTSLEDAQINAVTRILARYGRLLGPDELKAAARTDVAAFPPTVRFRYQRELEPPDSSEGFSRIDTVAFERRSDPSMVNRAVIVWCDGVLLRSRSGLRTACVPEDVDVPPGRGDVLRRYAEDGWKVLGLSWMPEIAGQAMTPAGAAAVFARMQDLLGIGVAVEYCPHAAGPPVCWCRKPLPGLGVVFQQRHRLDPARCIYVGSGAQDPGFARRLGFQYQDAAGFFQD